MELKLPTMLKKDYMWYFLYITMQILVWDVAKSKQKVFN